MQLKQINDRVYYLLNPVNIGVIKSDEGVILIDTGLDKRTGRKILETLNEEGLSPVAIINTHSHADHCGGNNFIKKETDAKIYAAEIEKDFIENTSLEPFCFFSGAEPIEDLKNKFLQAVPTKVDRVIKADSVVNINGLNLEIISLPGHSLNQIGVAYEGVLFCGDAIFSESILDKHQVPFCINIGKQKNTLEFLGKGSYQCYLPAHGELTVKKDIKKLAADNKQVIEKVEQFIIKITSTAKTSENILKEVCSKFNYRVGGAYQYYLLKTSVAAYLSYLYNNNMIKYIIKDSLLYWQNK